MHVSNCTVLLNGLWNLGSELALTLSICNSWKNYQNSLYLDFFIGKAWWLIIIIPTTYTGSED